MVALIILGILALIIFAVCLIPVGADIAYLEEKLTVSATVCGQFIQLFPRPPKPEGEEKPKKPKKEKKPKEPKKEDPDKPKKKKGIPLGLNKDEILGILKAVFRGLGKFRKFAVDRFILHTVIGGKDPYNTAMAYGYLNAFLSALAPVCRENMTVKESDVFTDVDFTADDTSLELALGFSIRIGQILGAVNTILFGALGIVIKNRFRILGEKIGRKLRGEKEETSEEETPETTTEETNLNTNESNKQEDERTNDNGKH